MSRKWEKQSFLAGQINHRWIYSLVNVYAIMEHRHAFVGQLTITMAIFNSHVKLPGSICLLC